MQWKLTKSVVHAVAVVVSIVQMNIEAKVTKRKPKDFLEVRCQEINEHSLFTCGRQMHGSKDDVDLLADSECVRKERPGHTRIKKVPNLVLTTCFRESLGLSVNASVTLCLE